MSEIGSRIGRNRKEQSAMGKTAGSCECCINYEYDEDYECYVCEMDLDEDEMVLFLSNRFDNCPYFQYNDEYRIVRKQM